MTDGIHHSSVEEQLAQHGELYTTTSGDSMKPLFRTHGCTVKLVVPQRAIKRDDVVLWRSGGVKYLLHRVVRVTDDDMVITRGDNRRQDDPPVARGEILAVLDGYYKKEKFVPVTARRYRLYVRLWGRPNVLRNIYLWLRDGVKRICGREVR